MRQVELWTDGSCLSNPGEGGWAFILLFGNAYLKETGYAEKTTNNRMELTAVIEGLKRLKEPCEVTLYSDSNYVLKPISEKWLDGWQKIDFAGKQNSDLWKEFLEISKMHKINVVKVLGHSKITLNEQCDILAKEAARERKGKIIRGQK